MIATKVVGALLETEIGQEEADLACRRGDRLLFARLSFALEGGQALQLAGSNGIGKSSLIRILAGLLAAAALPIAVTSADCVPILAARVDGGAVAALHAGRFAAAGLLQAQTYAAATSPAAPATRRSRRRG